MTPRISSPENATPPLAVPLRARGGRRSLLLLLGVALVGIALGLVPGTTVPPANAAAPVPFSCTVPTVFDSNGSPTVLNAQVQAAGGSAFVPIGAAAPVDYNAIGYNPGDNLIYGVDLVGTNHLVIIDSTGAVFDQGAITGLPASANITVGFFDGAGNFWISDSTQGTLYKVDLTTLSATPLTLSAALYAYDMTEADGYAWGIEDGTTTSGVGIMYRVNLATGTVDSFDVNSILPVGTGNAAFYGAAWTYANGNLGFDRNDGGLYQVSVTNPGGSSPTFALVAKSPGPASDNNDGTYCGSAANLTVATTASTSADAAGGSVVTAGGTVTWMVTATNAGPGYSSGFGLSDLVPTGYTSVAVVGASSNLVGANSGNGYGCTVTAGAVKCIEGFGSSGLAPGATATLTLTATAPGSGCAGNVATVLGNEQTNGTQTSNTATTCVGGYRVSMSASRPTAAGIVTRTVVVVNTGSMTYTTAVPAKFSENLSGVLDHATFVTGSATSSVAGWTFTGPRGTPATLAGRGPLPLGTTATITYLIRIDAPAPTANAPSASERAPVPAATRIPESVSAVTYDMRSTPLWEPILCLSVVASGILLVILGLARRRDRKS